MDDGLAGEDSTADTKVHLHLGKNLITQFYGKFSNPSFLCIKYRLKHFKLLLHKVCVWACEVLVKDKIWLTWTSLVNWLLAKMLSDVKSLTVSNSKTISTCPLRESLRQPTQPIRLKGNWSDGTPTDSQRNRTRSMIGSLIKWSLTDVMRPQLLINTIHTRKISLGFNFIVIEFWFPILEKKNGPCLQVSIWFPLNVALNYNWVSIGYEWNQHLYLDRNKWL